MSGLFGNLNEDPKMLRHALKSRYNAARINLLLMIIFTAVNITTLIINTGGYFLFSASVPYLLVFAGLLICGMLPAEAYSDSVTPDMFMDKSVFVGATVIAALIMVIYLLLWIFSKKGRVAFMITALVLFSLDTVVLLIFAPIMGNFFMDLLFHIWLIVILYLGIKAHKQLATMPKENVPIEGEFSELPCDEEYESADDEACCEDAPAEIEAPDPETYK